MIAHLQHFASGHLSQALKPVLCLLWRCFKCLLHRYRKAKRNVNFQASYLSVPRTRRHPQPLSSGGTHVCHMDAVVRGFPSYSLALQLGTGEVRNAAINKDLVGAVGIES